MKLFLFDFDGTIISKDSMLEFLKHLHNSYFIYLLLNFIYLPIHFLYLIKLIKKQKAKEIFLKIHFYNYNYSFLVEKSESFSKIILQFTYKEFDDFIKNIDFNLNEICIVSASLDIWMLNIAKNLNMKLICTQSQVNNNSFIGINSNCYGIEKVNRIVKVYNIDNYDEVHVFGDSNGDSEMLKLGHRHYKFFN